jgi:hypothetical protein
MKPRLYTTAGCHLCAEAEKMLAALLPVDAVERIDVAESDDLIARYGERIPVLEQDGRELGWPFSLLDLRAFLTR